MNPVFGKVWGLVVLKITILYQNKRFFRLMVFKITGVSDYLPFSTQISAIHEKGCHTSYGARVNSMYKGVFYRRTSVVATKACLRCKKRTQRVTENNPEGL